MKKITSSIIVFMLTLFLVVSFSLIGCKEEAAPAAGEVQKEIAFIPPAMVSPYYAAMIDGKGGARDKAEELGYKLTVLSPDREDNYEEQARIMEDMINKGVDVICVSAINSDAIVAPVKKANEAGIPVIVFTITYELPGGEIFAYSGYDNYEAGIVVGEYLKEISEGKEIKVGVLEGLPSSFTTDRTGGFLEAIEGAGNIEFIGSQPADWEREKGMNVTTNMLQANPEINAFYANSDEMILGAAKAYEAIGKKAFQAGGEWGEEYVILMGLDGNPNAVEAVCNGEITSTLNVDPVQIGANTIIAADKAIKGEECEFVINTNPFIVDKSNCEEYRVEE